jgi:5,10-methylenetetrahydromethanopterin reductase
VRELGIGVAPVLGPAEMADLAERVETLGFDVLSVFGDLGMQPPIPALLIGAARTRRVRLGPGCMNPYTTHPMEIAGQIAYVDAVSGGRAYLGLARGAWLDRLGLAQPRPVAAIRDAVEIVRRLLRGDASGYAGRVFQLDPGIALEYPVERSEIPLLIGGWGPRITALAGELAEEQKLGASANPELTKRLARQLGGTGTRLVVGTVTVVDADGARARASARRRAAPYIEVVGALDPTFDVDPDLLRRLRPLLREGALDVAAALVPDDVLDRFALAGTPGQVAEHAAALFAAGAERIEFGPPFGVEGLAAGLELLAKDVVPALRPATL